MQRTHRQRIGVGWLIAMGWALAAPARAAGGDGKASATASTPQAALRGPAAMSDSYALVIGSNVGGRGQATLHYAEEDARRVADVLISLGGYPASQVERISQPSAAGLRAAIERVRQRVAPLAERGAQARFFFYYSGHARADALNLGADQLPLSELRERITSLPATLSIVVLDACQSGAFSRIKGADRAADFSFNSIDRLNTEGIAVIASSSARELSQESEELRSGYFTHHWLVGLRGAGDRDSDGRVTLSEAYQYAYNHTLATTAETSVGEQHPTLETNFRGKDDVPLTHPAAANARLRVPAALEGRVLLQSLPSWSVLAELNKAPGQAVLLALPAGRYAASLRRGTTAARCLVSLRDGAEVELATDHCQRVVPPPSAAKGAHLMGRPDGRVEGWLLELGVGVGLSYHRDAYTRRLVQFDFEPESRTSFVRLTINLGRRLTPNLLFGLSYFNLEAFSFARELDVKQGFSWRGHALAPFLQADLGLGPRRLLNLFGRLGVGASLGSTTFDAVVREQDWANQNSSLNNTTATTHEVSQTFFRPCGFLGAGVQIMPSRYIGMQFEVRYVVAPALENEFGERHDLGGFVFTTGLKLRTWE
jgi:hypothetical protein